ncbi:MAG: hypothetical protein R2822_07490 [Spirosomataceae bacterium]
MLSSDELKNYAQNLPKTWEEADAILDLKVRQQLLKTDIMPTLADEQKYTQAGYDFSKWFYANNPSAHGQPKPCAWRVEKALWPEQ